MAEASQKPPTGELSGTAPEVKLSPLSSTPNVVKKGAAEGNPAFRAMGLPNWTPKLPGRNWLIFWGIVGSWTGALVYDRQMQKKNQKKWCTLVSHIAHEPLPTNQLPRRMTIYLSAPISDSLSMTREHFVEYVKPILVAAAMDWDVVEGRREGEVRAALAERLRRRRHAHGEAVTIPFEDTPTSVLEPLRARIGVQDWQGEKGDIIVGRNTWKEYVRGLHEGWLGPMDAPLPPPVELVEPVATIGSEAPTAPATWVEKAESDIPATPALTHTSTLATPTAETPPPQEARIEAEEAKTPEETKPEEPAEPVKPLVTQPYNSPDSYPSSHLPASIPEQFSAATPIPFPHILGFFNTPIRMYRFLNRRQLADDIGRRTAAAVLAASRPFHHETSTSDGVALASWEQQNELRQEESEWHKSVKEPKEYAKERVWLDEVAVDPRIGERMRRFELTAADEDRARSIAKGTAGIPGRRGEDEEK